MIYRKQGSVVRFENGVLVRVSESGRAREDGDVFSCAPEEASSRPVVESSSWVMDTAAAIASMVPAPLCVERLIVSEGFASHECDGRVWSESSRRVHVSIVRGSVRALIDSADDVARVVDALSRLDDERDPPARLRLAPAVAAALTPALIGLAPPNVELWQTAGGVDGYGHPIESVRVDTPPYPNWFRPSYRVRPVRMPLDVRVRCAVTEIGADRPLAVALLEPAGGLVLRVLVDDGRRAWPCTVRVARIDAVAEEAVWYPYGGGSFGAEMML